MDAAKKSDMRQRIVDHRFSRLDLTECLDELDHAETKLRTVLRAHWLTWQRPEEIINDPQSSIGAKCACGFIEPHPTLGATVNAWIDHVISLL